MVTPSAAASCAAVSNAVMDCAVQVDSALPQLDGDHGRLIRRVVDGGGERVLISAGRIGREIDYDPGAGRNGADDFDIEKNFAIGAIGSGGRVCGLVNGDGDHGGLLLQTQGLRNSFGDPRVCSRRPIR